MSFLPKKILVTGSAGFIGFTFCKYLLQRGHRVIGIDNHNNDYNPLLKENHTNELKEYLNFEFIKLDIANEAIHSIMHDQTVDYVVHLAAKDMYYDHVVPCEYTPFIQTNVVGTSKILDLAYKLKAKKFIYASTFSVYGKTKKPMLSEKNILPKPTSPHGASKIAAEQIVSHMSHYYKLPTVIARIFSTYGPHMRPHTMIPKFINNINKNTNIDLYSDINGKRDFIYVDDVVYCLYELLNKRVKLQTVNIATGKSHSYRDVASVVASSMGKTFQDDLLTRSATIDFSNVVSKAVHADVSRLKKIIGHTKMTDLEIGLKKTTDWYLSHPEVLKDTAL